MRPRVDTAAFTLPECSGGSLWSLLIETSREPTGSNAMFETGDVNEMTARSLVLFVLASLAA